MRAPYLVGSDIGGTFTDLVVLGDDGDVLIAKAPSTPPDFENGLWDALNVAAGKLNIDVHELLAQARQLGHGTTVATNAIINERGARVGLITTKGFEQTLWQMRGAAYCQGLPMEYWTHKVANPRPFEIVAASDIAGVSERIDRNGQVLCALNETEVEAAIARLRAAGVETLAVAFLWSFLNPVHEQRVREIAAAVAPGLPVTLSSDIIPVLGEYERFSTTALNAFLRPEVENYIRRMLDRLAKAPHPPKVYLMQANGGLAAPARAAAEAVRLLQSGPVGGVVAGLAVADSIGAPRVITADMGGTSFDVCLLDGAAPYAARSVHNRHVVATRMIDIESIGAGGGSLARVVRGNLQVGPDSAGARPGPVCYGRGGTQPTVTDANAVLGYLNPRSILGGKMAIDLTSARRAIEEKIARPLGISVEEAALGIVRVVNAHMADLIRFHALRRGRDPRDYLTICFGGATALHAAGIAEEIGVQRMLVPLAGTATVLSALGIADSPQMWFFTLGRVFPLDVDHADKLGEAYDELLAQARAQLSAEGVDDRSFVWVRTASVRYRLQVNELDVPVAAGKINPQRVRRLARDFDRVYESTYGKGAGFREGGREVVAVHLKAVAPGERTPFASHPLGEHDPGPARLSERQAWFSDGWQTVHVYDGDRLTAGHVVPGPAVLETEGTTILVPPGWSAAYDRFRHIMLERSAA